MILCGLAGAGGCVTEHVNAPRPARPVPSQGADTCSDNMHDLCGYLLQYYWLHAEFPAQLSSLQSLVDLDRKLPLACPVSGQPYLYYPTGLTAPGEKRRLVVVDAQPVHTGARWAVVAMPPEGSQPVALWVIRLDEASFKKYQPAP